MKDCIEVICSRCTYRWQCGPFNQCVPKKILLHEMEYRTPAMPKVMTTTEYGVTVMKNFCCPRCNKHYLLQGEIENEIKFCPNCGQKLDWSGLCDK